MPSAPLDPASPGRGNFGHWPYFELHPHLPLFQDWLKGTGILQTEGYNFTPIIHQSFSRESLRKFLSQGIARTPLPLVMEKSHQSFLWQHSYKCPCEQPASGAWTQKTRGCGMTEVEIRVMWPQTQECQRHPKLEGARDRFSPSTSRGGLALLTLISDFCSTASKKVSCFIHFMVTRHNSQP